MLTLTCRYRIYPNAALEQQLIEWMDICRNAYNYALREIKDWCNSRKCLVDRCSIEKEYILSSELKFPSEIQQLNNLPKAKKEFPRLSEVPSQVLQQTIKQLHVGWKYFQERGFGFPRFKKYGQFNGKLNSSQIRSDFDQDAHAMTRSSKYSKQSSRKPNMCWTPISPNALTKLTMKHY